MIPDIQKYLLKTAIENIDFFDEECLEYGQYHEGTEGWRIKLLEKIGIGSQEAAARRYFHQSKQKIKEEAEKFELMLAQFYEKKGGLRV